MDSDIDCGQSGQGQGLTGSRSWLLAKGFTQIGSIAHLQANGIPDAAGLERPGVYGVVRCGEKAPQFVSPSDARRAGNVIRPHPVADLRLRWVSGAEVVYIGAVGTKKRPRSLRLRLRELIKHSLGQTSSNGPHKGGEMLWQIGGYGALQILVLGACRRNRPLAGGCNVGTRRGRAHGRAFQAVPS
jgi:hypothetical protein